MSRVQVAFNAEQTELIQKIAIELGITRSAVVRRALALFEVAHREVKAGNTVSIVDANGKILKEITGIK